MCSQTPVRDATRRRPAWRHALAALIPATLLVMPLQGMIFTLTLLDLVKQSDFIMIARVEKVSVVGKGRAAGGLTLVDLKNELTPLESLKGAWPSRQAVLLSTFKPERGWLEDNVEIPPAGFRVLLFLAEGPDGRLMPVNGIQGVWPMEGDTLLGMGFGKSLAGVRQGVRKGEAAGVFAQGLLLQKQGDLKGAVEKYRLSLRDWRSRVHRRPGSRPGSSETTFRAARPTRMERRFPPTSRSQPGAVRHMRSGGRRAPPRSTPRARSAGARPAPESPTLRPRRAERW